MSDTTYNIYRDGDKIVSNTPEKTYTDTGLDPNTSYSYQISAENKSGESDLSEPVLVTTDVLIVNSQEVLISAIQEADAGDTIELASGFTIEKSILIDKDITIDGGGHTIISDLEGEGSLACFRVTGEASVKNVVIELVGEGDRAFTLHTMATGFSLEDSSITGGDTSVNGHRGVGSSIEGEGDVVIDNVVFDGLRVGMYQVGDHLLEINHSTFENSHRGISIEGSSVPTLVGNTFTNNDGDISISDSEIKDEITQEAENPDNNNTFDDDKPKYNWVTSITISPKTNNLEVGDIQSLQVDIESSVTGHIVTWSSSDEEIVEVDSDGKITALAEGTATITAESEGKSDTATVTVTEPVIDVTSVTLSPKTSGGESGIAGSAQLSATVDPSNATNDTVSYSIAPTTTGLSVNNTGLISWTDTVPAGEYTTTVTTSDGSHTDTHVLTLTEPEEPEPEPEEE